MLLECPIVMGASVLLKYPIVPEASNVEMLYCAESQQHSRNVPLCQEPVVFSKCAIMSKANHEPMWCGCVKICGQI